MENRIEMKKRFINTALTSAAAIDVETTVDIPNPIAAPNLLNDARVLGQPVFCAAMLIVSKTVITINLTWVKGFDIVQSCNKGLKSANTYIVFYSPDIDAEPDFSKKIAADFVENESALYMASICKFFGELNIYLF